MSYALLLIPLFTAVSCWFMAKFAISSLFRPYIAVNIAGFTWQGALPRAKETMALSTANSISAEILRSSFIHEKLTGTETLEKAMPAIEAHIDNFLNYKLKEAIPVISMFIGEKITSQLKELFLEELKTLFPSIMSQFIGNLSQSGELANEIAVKLQLISIEQTEQLFYKRFKKELAGIRWGFAIAGLLMGSMQLLLTLWITG